MKESLVLGHCPGGENDPASQDKCELFQAWLEYLFPTPEGITYTIHSESRVVMEIDTTMPQAIPYALFVEEHMPLYWDVPDSYRCVLLEMGHYAYQS